MEHLAKRQSQLDREGVLLDKEEKLYERKGDLEQYEKEVNIFIKKNSQPFFLSTK